VVSGIGEKELKVGKIDANMAKVIFKVSEGWKLNGPSFSQRSAPPESTPRGVKTKTNKTIEMASKIMAIFS